MSKELEEFYQKYSARITEIDDTPLFATGTFGKFKMLAIEEYENLTHENKILAKALELMSIVLCTESRDDLRNKIKKFAWREDVVKFFKQQAEKEIGSGKS